MLGILQNDDTIRLDGCCSCAFIHHPEDGEDGGGSGGGRGIETSQKETTWDNQA